MKRTRNLFIYSVVGLFIFTWLFTDPDLNLLENLPVGAGLLSLITSASGALFGVIILHFTRKGLMDYQSADFGDLLDKCTEPTSAGLGAIAVALQTMAFAIVIAVGFMAF